MAECVVDTSLLYVLTAVERLDLLAHHKPLAVTKRAKGEHEQHGTPRMNDYLRECEGSGLVRIVHPSLDAQSRALQAKYRQLSFTDANCLALAMNQRAFLLAEDKGLLEAAEAESVDWVDLSALLFTCHREGLLSQRDAQQLVADIESKAHHNVRGSTKRGLGIQ